MEIRSWKGPYEVHFNQTVAEAAAEIPRDRPYHCIIDARVLGLHREGLASLLAGALSTIEIDATENNKSLENMTLVERLSAAKVKRDHLLVAIGGGITQDLTCFAASILFRGMEWAFLPTTLLAQADSCIGSKSSINAAGTKNLVGTFHAPVIVSVGTDFLSTLDERDVRSGIGEMLKVHIIDGPDSFDRLAADYDRLGESEVMLRFIRASLEIKKRLIELDEFDRGPRNVMNYGHSFGHAIEAATGYAVPHGIAVTIGADMANFVAAKMGRMDESHYRRMHPVLRKNYRGFETIAVPEEPILSALSRDKKNAGTVLMLILPDARSVPEKVPVPMSPEFRQLCVQYLNAERTRP